MKAKISIKTLTLFFVIFSVSAGNVLANQNKNILWDFRKDEPAKTPEFSKTETNAVLKYLLGSGWDNELGITNRVSGAFTKANAKETLYYVDGCEEDGVFKSNSSCAHVSWHNAGRIAIYDGTKPVAKISEALGYEIAQITDLNEDGVNEIFSLDGWGGQGITITNASLGQISGGKYRRLKGFEGYVDNCGNDRGVINRVATVISYGESNAGKMPVFSAEYFKSGCRQQSLWKKITKKQYAAFAGKYS